jgi:hypothetical protein
MTPFEEINVPDTNAPVFCDNKVAIDIAYNQKIGNRSKYIHVAHHLVLEKGESRQISLLQIELADNWADIWINELLLVILQKLRTAIIDAKLRGMLDFGGYIII